MVLLSFAVRERVQFCDSAKEKKKQASDRCLFFFGGADGRARQNG